MGERGVGGEGKRKNGVWRHFIGATSLHVTHQLSLTFSQRPPDRLCLPGESSLRGALPGTTHSFLPFLSGSSSPRKERRRARSDPPVDSANGCAIRVRAEGDLRG